MQIYPYKCPECGHRFDHMMQKLNPPDTLVCGECGYRKCKQDWQAKFAGGDFAPGNWPMESDAAGVHPDQIPEAVEHAKSIGVPTEFNKAGNPILRSPQHRAAYLRGIGMFDRDAGYSDPAPNEHTRPRSRREQLARKYGLDPKLVGA